MPVQVGSTGYGDGVTVVSNTYENGQGIIECSGTITRIPRYPTNKNMLNSIVLPDGLVEIAEGAFVSAINLHSIIIPDSVEIIGNNAFGNKMGTSTPYYYLTVNPTISNDNHLTKIGECVFANSSGINGTLVLGKYADVSLGLSYQFEHCTGLTTLYIYGSGSYLNTYSFAHCTNLSEIYCYINPVRYDSPWGGSDYKVAFTSFTDVAPIGTFHYPKNQGLETDYQVLKDGGFLPSGWTLVADL